MSKRLGRPNRALAEASYRTGKLPPVTSLSPGTVPAWGFIVPVAHGGACTALGTPDSAGLGMLQCPACASPRELPPSALLPWVPSTTLPPPPLSPLSPGITPSSAGMCSHSRAHCQGPGGARASKSRAAAEPVEQSLGEGCPWSRTEAPAPFPAVAFPCPTNTHRLPSAGFTATKERPTASDPAICRRGFIEQKEVLVLTAWLAGTGACCAGGGSCWTSLGSLCARGALLGLCRRGLGLLPRAAELNTKLCTLVSTERCRATLQV